MRASSLTSAIYRLSKFHNANTQSPFLTAFETAFRKGDVRQAAETLAKATDTDWTDLSAYICKSAEVGDAVRLLLEACKCMPHDQDKAAETLLNIVEELREAPADGEHGPAALEHMLHASTHAWLGHLLAARPDLLERYCALLGKGPDAARAYCMLAKHLASMEDTTPYAWEVWQRSVKALDGATRLHVTTHIRAIDRPIFNINKKQNSLYRSLARQMSDQSGFKTRLPIYRFVFDGTLKHQLERRYISLRAFLYNAGRVLGRPAELKEFEGIRLLQTSEGRLAIELHYSSHVADTMRYYMGFADTYDWPYENGYQSTADQVTAEFEELWADVKPASTLPKASELSWCERASRKKYAAAIQQLSAYNLLIGESHDHFAALNFLIQNMRWLRSVGYTVLYLENMPAEAQGLVNDFLYGKGPMAPELQLIHRREFLGLLMAAKEAGMRVAFVDTELAGGLNTGGEMIIDPKRCGAFNAFACSVINDDAELSGGEKFVMLLGGYHMWKDNAPGAKGAWGVQHALPNCKSLFMFDMPTGSDVIPEEPFFIWSHDQKYKLPLTEKHVMFKIVADVCIGAYQPARMSVENTASSDFEQRGFLPFEMPPEFSTT